MWNTTYVYLAICHRMASSRILFFVWPWPTFSRSNMWNVNISETVRASATTRKVAFIDVDICHWMAAFCTPLHRHIISMSTIWNVYIWEMVKKCNITSSTWYYFNLIFFSIMIAKLSLSMFFHLFDTRRRVALVHLYHHKCSSFETILFAISCSY